MAEGQKEAWGGDKMKIILFKPAPRHQNIKCHIMCSTLLHYISFEIWVVKRSIQIPIIPQYRDHLVGQLTTLCVSVQVEGTI